MKTLIFITLLLAGINGTYAQKVLPEATVENLKGEEMPAGKILEDKVPVVLAFWGTTCKPCLMELDALADLYEEWQQQVKFKVVAVATDDSRAASKVRGMVNGREWPFEVLLDKNQELKRAMNVNTIPCLYVLDAHGNIVYAHSGYTPGSENEVLKKLKELKKTTK